MQQRLLRLQLLRLLGVCSRQPLKPCQCRPVHSSFSKPPLAYYYSSYHQVFLRRKEGRSQVSLSTFPSTVPQRYFLTSFPFGEFTIATVVHPSDESWYIAAQCSVLRLVVPCFLACACCSHFNRGSPSECM